MADTLRFKNIGWDSYLLEGTHKTYTKKQIDTLARTNRVIVNGGFSRHKQTRRGGDPLQVERLSDGRYRLLAYGPRGKVITEQELQERAAGRQVIIWQYK